MNHCLTLGRNRYHTMNREKSMEIATVIRLVPPMIPIAFPMMDKTRKTMASILAQFFPLRKAHASTSEIMAMIRNNNPNTPKNTGALLMTQSGTEVPILFLMSVTLIKAARRKKPNARISSNTPPNI